MATLKVILRKKQNKDGSYPLAIRITKNRKSSYIHVGHHVFLKDWDAKNQAVKKSHPNSVRLNNLLMKKRAEANDTLINMETRGEDFSATVIKKQINPKDGITFFAQAKIYTTNLEKNGKYNRYKTEIGRVQRFKEFLGRDITFSEISVNLLNQFRSWLKSTRDIKERTIVNHLLTIRTIYNQAIKSHLVDNKKYPFGKDKIVIKFPDSLKIGLTADEVRKLESLDLTGYQNHARNVWLVSLNFAGMRLADVIKLRWSDFKDGRIHYAMSKNLKTGSLKISDKAKAILKQYKTHPQKHDFVFPELKVLDELTPYEVQRKIAYAGKRLEKALKLIAKDAGIEKNISMHIARHTFAQISGDRIPVQILQQLYRHSNIQTTMGYQSNFTNKHKDDALDLVLNS